MGWGACNLECPREKTSTSHLQGGRVYSRGGTAESLRNGLWELGEAGENWGQQRRSLLAVLAQASLCTTDITKEMGSPEAATATPGPAGAWQRKAGEGKGKSRARERLVNASQDKARAASAPAPRPLPCVPPATSHLHKGLPPSGPFFLFQWYLPDTHHTHHKSGPLSSPNALITSLISHSPLLP